MCSERKGNFIANYPPIFEWTLRQEDATLSAKTYDLHDGGARTRLGITERANPTAVRDGFFEMEREDAINYARDYYKHAYCFPVRCEEIHSDEVAASLFSFAVNDGPAQAAKELQRAADVTVDGIIGGETLAAVNRANPTLLSEALREQQAEFYRQIVARHPENGRFLQGWLNRAGRKYPELN